MSCLSKRGSFSLLDQHQYCRVSITDGVLCVIKEFRCIFLFPTDFLLVTQQNRRGGISSLFVFYREEDQTCFYNDIYINLVMYTNTLSLH